MCGVYTNFRYTYTNTVEAMGLCTCTCICAYTFSSWLISSNFVSAIFGLDDLNSLFSKYYRHVPIYCCIDQVLWFVFIFNLLIYFYFSIQLQLFDVVIHWAFVTRIRSNIYFIFMCLSVWPFHVWDCGCAGGHQAQVHVIIHTGVALW